MDFSSLNNEDRIALSLYWTRMERVGDYLERLLEAIDQVNEQARKLGLPTIEPHPPETGLVEARVRSGTNAGHPAFAWI